ncbi:MAG: hypothetical protein KKC79_15665 [Gammaproteobacteria bacterium]|nr:hypothetical protein [Gammaproteobacteria bacterium]MBU1439692.1 hypothetical protein [Gammaproteobacteria bacterium]MBU2287890.1 hypothetical protein [Gammaproteobacteria bacterium]MBU2410074.1 hypothetical protein [Gammaproteobacteria bacterium]
MGLSDYARTTSVIRYPMMKTKHILGGAAATAAAGTASLLYGHSHGIADALFGAAALGLVLAFVIVDRKASKEEARYQRRMMRSTVRGELGASSQY